MTFLEAKSISNDEPIRVSFPVGSNELIFYSEPSKFNDESVLMIALKFNDTFYGISEFINGQNNDILLSDKWEIGRGFELKDIKVVNCEKLLLQVIFSMLGLTIEVADMQLVKGSMNSQTLKATSALESMLDTFKKADSSIDDLLALL